MTGLRRGLLLLAALLTVLVGFDLSSASAAFTDKAQLSVSVGTLRVAPPTGLSTAGTKCSTTYDAYGNPTTTLQARVSWQGSTTPKVTSYDVMAYSSGWSYLVTTVDSSTTVVTGTYDSYYASQNIQVVVTARTSYGWTAESAKSGVIKC